MSNVSVYSEAAACRDTWISLLAAGLWSPEAYPIKGAGTFVKIKSSKSSSNWFVADISKSSFHMKVYAVTPAQTTLGPVLFSIINQCTGKSNALNEFLARNRNNP